MTARCRLLSLLIIVVTLSAGAGPALAQTKPAEAPRASAVKLPDGTVVFVTKNPDDANPTVDGVVLSGAEYQALVEQAAALKKLKENAKPVSPSSVAVRGKVEARGDRTVVAVSAAFAFRTAQANTVVTLGCQRAAVVAARGPTGALPALAAADDGFTVLVPTAGEHTLTLDLEVPVAARGAKGEVGAEFGLPRAAISTLTLEKPPADVKAVTVGTRSGEPGGARRTAVSAEQLAARPFPLGPTDTLELTWEPPGSPAKGSDARSAESDTTVRVDDAQVETVCRLRLRGGAKEWPLVLPANAEVDIERGTAAPGTPGATVVKPTDPAKPTWLIRTPPDPTGADWVVIVSVRQPRPKATDPKSRGPYPVGPFHVTGLPHTGKVKVFATPAVRLGFRPAADLRRQDLPAAAEDDLIAAFAYTAGGKAGAWLDLDARPAPNVARVSPKHKLRLTAAGWRLESVVRVVPPPRAELDHLVVELPTAWQGIEFAPADLIDPVTEAKDGAATRLITLRFAAPQKAAFDLTLTATHPVAPMARESVVPLPRFPQADEREAKFTAAVPDGLAVGGTGYGWEGGQPGTVGELLRAAARGPATSVSGEFDRGVSRVELSWEPYRPELGCEVRAEVTVGERQLNVAQVFRFRPADGDARPIRLRRGASELVGLQFKPPLEPVGPNEWEFKPTAEAGKESVLTAQYAVKLPPAKSETAEPLAVPLLWPDAATKLDAVVRVWGGGGPRAEGVGGNWREVPPEAAAERDALPWFTLAASGPEPLTLTLADPDGAGGSAAVVERAVVQAVLADDGTAAVRGRFVLRRWVGTGVFVELPGGVSADVFVDGKRVDPIPRGDGIRVPLPDLKPGRTACLLDVRYQAAATDDGLGGRVVVPPAVRRGSYRTAVRWTVACAGTAVPLLFSPAVQVDARWAWRGFGFGPVAVDSPADLERWLRDAADADAADAPFAVGGGESLSARQAVPTRLTVTPAPRLAWLAVSSFLALAVLTLLVRAGPRGRAAGVVLLAVLVSAGAVLCPQPTAQFAAAAQPGLLLGLAGLFGSFTWRRYARWKRDRLLTFSRIQPPAAAPSVGRSIRGDSSVPHDPSVPAGS